MNIFSNTMELEKYSIDELRDLFRNHLSIPTAGLVTKEDYILTFLEYQDMARQLNDPDMPTAYIIPIAVPHRIVNRPIAREQDPL